jgi:GH25 family lysozyme M1 (1,4-beta-N-acetylmuramidase)
MAHITGIDVSNWQGTIDWRAVRASGVEFAITKISEGTTFYDGTASANYTNGKSAGLLMGGYHFAGGGDPIAEADHFVNGMKPFEEGDIFVLDWEIQVGNPVGWCETFVQRVHDLTGVWCLMYMNGSTRNAYNWTAGVLKNCGFWIAWYGRDPEGDLPVQGGYIMHQYTSDGTVSGIGGRVDMDAFYGTVSQLRQYGYQAPVVTPAPVPEPTPTPTPTPPPAPVPQPVPVVLQPSELDKENNTLLKQILELLQALVRKFTNIFK